MLVNIIEKAKNLNKKILLTEGEDHRVRKAAKWLVDNGICSVRLVFETEYNKIESGLIGYSDRLILEASDSSIHLDFLSSKLFELRNHKGITLDDAILMTQKPIFFSALSVAAGLADGCVAGAVHTTGDVLRAAIQVIGLKENSEVVSSIFLMTFNDGRVFTYADCAVVPYPDSTQLATIAIDSAQTHKALTGREPKVAMLSFSTKGSANHERVDLVREAFDLVRLKKTSLKIDGELQFDASIIPEIAKKKAPDSDVAGFANVFIFPNLDAGNIAYKITERLAGATATGPIIQGLSRPMNDLSRGCNWEDIVNTSCVTLLQS